MGGWGMGSSMNSYRNLIAWQKAIETTRLVYRLTEYFPKSELFGLTSQMRRAAVSISSNIAEGYYRYNRKEYRHFCSIAFGSAAELETQIYIAKQLNFTNKENFIELDACMASTMKLLNKLTQSLKS